MSTGELVRPAWTQFSFPVRWHYDVLRALEDGDGRPSRWNTLRAMRVLEWYGK